ncbi:uncharacterized protein LOC121186041 [Toxotes jaculatrix]|uniref:uncharacterized protein LOC121186041 n=1 Tax=Toxotes jaculatrix TaxID=941984 RepID=UPI001B3B0B58|nr:uncharacterized protein LOC121186041 [Toxotes jaculatrix]
MLPFRMLLCVVALALLAVTVESSSSSGSGSRNYNYDLSGPDLTRLFNSPVRHAERVERPINGPLSAFGVKHSGVRVTLDDDSQWLIHKGDGYGKSSQTVVTDARHMSSAWEPSGTSRDFDGSKTVSDFVAAGGSDYRLLRDNCHHASGRMMGQ